MLDFWGVTPSMAGDFGAHLEPRSEISGRGLITLIECGTREEIYGTNAILGTY